MMELRAWFAQWPVPRRLRATPGNRQYLPLLVTYYRENRWYYLVTKNGTRYYVERPVSRGTWVEGEVVYVPHERTGMGLTPIWSALGATEIGRLPPLERSELRKVWVGYRTLQALQEV